MRLFRFAFLLLCLTASSARGGEREEQEAAIKHVVALGGKVWFDYHRPDPKVFKTFDPAAQPRDPAAFHRVVFVDLRETMTEDHDLIALGPLSALEILDLTTTQVSDAGLRHLKGLRNLASLNLSKTPVTGAGMRHLKEMSSLRALFLWETKVDDEGLKELKQLTKMRELTLDGTKVSDAGLESLAGMTEMEEWLGLVGTNVTDAGLVHLTGMTRLKSLNLRQTGTTPEGIRRLRLALPKTDISSGP